MEISQAETATVTVESNLSQINNDTPVIIAIQNAETQTQIAKGAVVAYESATATLAEKVEIKINAQQSVDSATVNLDLKQDAVDSQTVVVDQAEIDVQLAQEVFETKTAEVNIQQEIVDSQTVVVAQAQSIVDSQTVQGLSVTVYQNIGYNQSPPMGVGTITYTGTDTNGISEGWGGGGPANTYPEDFQVRWQGIWTPTHTGTMWLHANADDGTRLYLDDVLIINDWVDKGGGGSTATVQTTAGVGKKFDFWFYENGGGAGVHLMKYTDAGWVIIPGSEFSQTSASQEDLNILNAEKTELATEQGILSTKISEKTAAQQDLTLKTQTYNTESATLNTLIEEKEIAEADLLLAQQNLETATANVQIAETNTVTAKTNLDLSIIDMNNAVTNAQQVFNTIRNNEEAARLAAIAEQQRLAAEAAARAEAERIAAEKAAAEEAARLEAERLAKEEAERLAAEEAARIEAERIEAERLEAERLAKEEADRLAAEEAERLEAERIAAEKAEEERLAEIEEAERLAAEKEAAEEAARLAAEEAAKPENIIEDAMGDGKITEEEKAAIVEAIIDNLKPGEAVSAEQIKESGISYADLPPETPIDIRTDENGNAVVIAAEDAANLELISDPGALVEELFTDPAAALAALGSIGADMSPTEREEAEKMVVATVVAAGAAMNAATVAAAGAVGGGAPSGGGSGSGGGGSSGGNGGGNSGGTRRNEKW